MIYQFRIAVEGGFSGIALHVGLAEKFLRRYAGRVPLVIELKSHFDGDRKLAHRLLQVLDSYQGPVAAMSFDPDQVLALRQLAPKLPRGITADVVNYFKSRNVRL